MVNLIIFFYVGKMILLFLFLVEFERECCLHFFTLIRCEFQLIANGCCIWYFLVLFGTVFSGIINKIFQKIKSVFKNYFVIKSESSIVFCKFFRFYVIYNSLQSDLWHISMSKLLE
jgi:hypothetical protein